MYTDVKQKIATLLLTLLVFSLCLSPSGITTTHAFGEAEKMLQIPESPQRIVVMPLFAEEMLLEMIGPDRIVGVWHEYIENGEAYSPTMALTKDMQHELGIDDAEGILALNPDLVVLYKANFGHYETLLPALEQSGVPSLFVDVPVNFDDMTDSLLMLGEVVGAQDKAAQMVRDVEMNLARLAEIVSSVPEDERIRVTHESDYRHVEVYDAIADAAAVISDRGTIFVSKPDYKEIDNQLLSEWNPDLITFAPFDTDTDGTLFSIGNEYTDSHIAYLLREPSLSTISAIQQRNVRPIVISNSQYMVQSAMELARLAYPDLFTEDMD